jgi:hypothetical protein
MDIHTLAYNLEDISGQLRVHLQASPLDDIIENVLEEVEEILKHLNQEL